MLSFALKTLWQDRPISGIVNKSSKRQNMNHPRDGLNGRLIKKSSSDHRQKHISDLNRDSFIPLQKNFSTPAAAYLDHSYQSLQCLSTQPSYDEDSFETFFSRKVKTWKSSRFVVDLHILCMNMKCLNCSRNMQLRFYQ